MKTFPPASLRRRLMAAVLAGTLGVVTTPTHALLGAGDIVFDPTNLAQNIMTAANTLQQINNQILQLQNQAQSLLNQARNLEGLDFSALNELRTALSATNQLIQQAQGLAFNVREMEAKFQDLYPDSVGAAVSSAKMILDARRRWSTSLEALRTAVRVQAQAVEGFATDDQALANLVNRSQTAVGALQAAQATNQLLALIARQAMQSQQLQITQDRTTALEQARQIAVQERAREVRRRFLGSGTPYTPSPVNLYGQ